MLAKSSPVTVGAMAGTPTRILLADDQPLFQRGLREVLDAEDDLEVVAETGGGAQALELAKREAIDLAVVISCASDDRRRARGRARPAPPKSA